VVVSAMGDTTNQLLELAEEVNPDPPKRELDMLLSVGERISISLLAMALAARNKEAVSFTGSQSGIITTECHSDAKILEVRPHRLMAVLEKGQIPIVAGFQGVSRKGEITTLGRGGSDTTAVALAVAMQGSEVVFYKDVPGIYDTDPKQDPQAQHLPELSYSRALGIVQNGAKVLHARAIAMAEKNGIKMTIRSLYCSGQTTIGADVKRSKQISYETES
jgi:aspartate kinase